jgi:hypothetical protein
LTGGCTSTISPTSCSYDGLQYFRLTRLGAYCLGIAETYEPGTPAVRASLSVFPDLRLQVTGAHLTSDEKRIGERYPSCPPAERRTIARHACRRRSGRVGRSSAAKGLDPDAVDLAVSAHLRHVHTRYDELLASDRR